MLLQQLRPILSVTACQLIAQHLHLLRVKVGRGLLTLLQSPLKLQRQILGVAVPRQFDVRIRMWFCPIEPVSPRSGASQSQHHYGEKGPLHFWGLSLSGVGEFGVGSGTAGKMPRVGKLNGGGPSMSDRL